MRLFTCCVLIFFSVVGHGQACPPNIDFENGSFDGWTCYSGITQAVGSTNQISLSPSGGPIFNKHTMLSANSGEVDPYGGFPVGCPNGSGYSVKLGSTEAGGQAEGISYEFTIPANANSYSLIYYYAVVFQSPNHRENEQPRMEIEVINVTDNSVISCASFAFIAVGSSLPGFKVSTSSDSTSVLYKEWSAVSVDLSGNAGKVIRLFFKTADCTFRRHFGYAYVDVNTECSGNLAGATYCPDDTVVNIVAPYGYEGYTWYDATGTRILGTQQTLTLSPPPLSGTTFSVKLDPYFGYGCPNTLFTTVKDSLTVIADAGNDVLSCNRDPVPIGTIPKQGLVYQWSPVTGLNNPALANPIAKPGITTIYTVTTTNSGGGCRTTDSVQVSASVIDNLLTVVGKDAYCFGYGDSSILQVDPIKSIEWFRDNLPINGTMNQATYRVQLPGTYFARLTNDLGCSITTQKKVIIIENQKGGITYPVKYAIINLPLVLSARPFGKTVIWNPGTALSNPTSFTPTFRSASEKLYTVAITSAAGCLTVDTQMVKIVPGVEIYVPTAFTPNSDGKNDHLHPVLRGIAEIRNFRVYNRWGQLLYEAKDELPGWNGSFKGLAQPPQTVVWMLECIGLDGVVYSKKGSSILIR